MKNYTRLSKQERCLIEMGIKERLSFRKIAKKIDRHFSSISREVKRNGGKLKYYAEKADFDKKGLDRRGFCKIDQNIDLQNYIRKKLDKKWSPEIIAATWKLNENFKISHETIYTWIYKQKDDLYLKLPRKKKKRGLKIRKNKSKIQNRVSIHERPEEINRREEVGHWEADLLFQQGNQSQNITTLIERKTRMVKFVKNKSKCTNTVINGISSAIKSTNLPVKTITFDNGHEFANHYALGIKTYFCDPGSPWQKGAVENINELFRRHVDYRIDINCINQDLLDIVAENLNNKPRKILGFLTPHQFFNESRVKLALPAIEALQ